MDHVLLVHLKHTVHNLAEDPVVLPTVNQAVRIFLRPESKRLRLIAKLKILFQRLALEVLHLYEEVHRDEVLLLS